MYNSEFLRWVDTYIYSDKELKKSDYRYIANKYPEDMQKFIKEIAKKYE